MKNCLDEITSNSGAEKYFKDLDGVLKTDLWFSGPMFFMSKQVNIFLLSEM